MWLDWIGKEHLSESCPAEADCTADTVPLAKQCPGMLQHDTHDLYVQWTDAAHIMHIVNLSPCYTGVCYSSFNPTVNSHVLKLFTPCDLQAE